MRRFLFPALLLCSWFSTSEAMHQLAAEELVKTDNRMVTAIAGRWTVMPEMQKLLDDFSPPAHRTLGGKIENLAIRFYPQEEFWEFRQVKQVKDEIMELAAKRGYEVVATGMLAITIADKPLASGGGFIMLTQKNGESFLSSIDIDSATFGASRVYHLPGETREKDMLITEFGGQRSILQYAGEIKTE